MTNSITKQFANIIIDISHEAIDRAFQYIVPENLREIAFEGCQVEIPFGKGNNIRTGYIVSFSDKPNWPIEKMKAIISVKEGSIGLESKTMELAYWMKRRYGCTLISAMQTVIPVKKKVKEQVYKTIYCRVSETELDNQISKCN